MDIDLNMVPGYCFACQEGGTIVHVNQQLSNDLGYAQTELAGNTLDIFFPVSTKIFYQTHLFPLLKMQGYASEIFLHLVSKEKSLLPVLLNVKRQQNNGEVVYVFIGILVQNRKKFEDELIAAKKSAENALKENTLLSQVKQELAQNLEQLDQQLKLVKKQNEELRQFNRIVTHDLTEPLRKLTMLSNMLLESMSDKVVQQKIIDRLLFTSGRMRSLVSGLQQYIWITETPVHLVSIDLKKLLLVLKQELRECFHGVEIVIELQTTQVLEGDWEQIRLLFYNLLENSVFFRKPEHKAEIIISVYNVRLNHFTSLAGKYKFVDFIRIDVRDNGVGFDPQFREQAFELFKKFHKEERQGIGLSICKKIVENHSGTISVNSKPGIGTTVTILLPNALLKDPAIHYNLQKHE